MNRFIVSFSILFFLGFSVKPQNTNNTVISQEKIKIEPLDIKDIKNTAKKEEKDSIIKAFNEETILSTSAAVKLSKKQIKVEKLRKEQEDAYDKLILSAQAALKKKEDKRVIVVTKSAFQQLKDGELMLVKDSTCTKKKFLSKKCGNWDYKYYLVDNKGKQQEL